MSIPTFVGAGDGTTITTGTGTISKTGCTAGNVIILHSAVAGTSDDGSRSNVVNMEAIDGTDGEQSHTDWRNIGSPAVGLHLLSLGRVLANGTCSVDWTTGASGEDFVGRLYEFSGVISSAVLAEIMEAGGNLYEFTQDTVNHIDDPSITTNGANRLACAFFAIIGNETIGDLTGETGGDWAEAVAEYATSVITLSLQIANMPSAANINGGSFTMSASRSWGTQGMGLIGTADASATFMPAKRRG